MAMRRLPAHARGCCENKEGRMSRSLIPPSLKLALRKQADPDCLECDGDGYVSVRSGNSPSYREVRCVCIDQPERPDDPEYSPWRP